MKRKYIGGAEICDKVMYVKTVECFNCHAVTRIPLEEQVSDLIQAAEDYWIKVNVIITQSQSLDLVQELEALQAAIKQAK